MKVWIWCTSYARQKYRYLKKTGNADILVFAQVCRFKPDWDEDNEEWDHEENQGICFDAICELTDVDKDELASWSEPRCFELQAKETEGDDYVPG